MTAEETRRLDRLKARCAMLGQQLFRSTDSYGIPVFAVIDGDRYKCFESLDVLQSDVEKRTERILGPLPA